MEVINISKYLHLSFNKCTIYKKGKSQKVITERGGCSRSAVSKHI